VLPELLGGRLGSVPLHEIARGAEHLADRFDHVNRDANRAPLIGDRAAHGLPDPPGCIRGKLEAAPVVELCDRTHEADVSLLNEIQQSDPTVLRPPGDGDDQPEVGLREPARTLRARVSPCWMVVSTSRSSSGCMSISRSTS
jgi:hypothetical protein